MTAREVHFVVHFEAISLYLTKRKNSYVEKRERTGRRIKKLRNDKSSNQADRGHCERGRRGFLRRKAREMARGIARKAFCKSGASGLGFESRFSTRVAWPRHHLRRTHGIDRHASVLSIKLAGQNAASVNHTKENLNPKIFLKKFSGRLND
jgi:hypothetical protein